jgi:hypothetical protein
MSEAEWQSCTDLQKMWWTLRSKPTRRQQQLFAAACCRRIWHKLDERCRRAIEILEYLADGHAMQDEWSDVCFVAPEVAQNPNNREIMDKAASAVAMADCRYDATLPATYAAEASNQPDERAAQASLLRDVLGNPFRPANFNRSWRTADVLELARSIYEERAFSQLPALGDALERAGCKDPEILCHCRELGPHIRGCWVLDLIVGTPPIPTGPRPDCMKPSDWDVCTDADKMLYCIGLWSSKRKLRLFACACCRRVWDYMVDERSRNGVEVAERYADGLASLQELETARKGTGDAWNNVMGSGWDLFMAARAAHYACLIDHQEFLHARHETRGVIRWSVAVDAAARAAEAEKVSLYLNREGPLFYAPQRVEAVVQETAFQAILLRDIFGNPLRPSPPIGLFQEIPQVRSLAQAIYDQGAFEQMPALADALQEAGCKYNEMLTHCRSPGPHVKGCWALDQLLGKD